MSRPSTRTAILRLALLLSAACPAAGLAAEAAQERQERAAPSLKADPVIPGKPDVKPYLSDAAAPDTLAILPPPPRGQSAAENADKAVFNVTRAYEGTARWQLAVNDVAEGSAALLEDFACTLGQRLDPARVPSLITLLDRARLDIVRAVRAPKVHYRRLRPFVGNDAPICVAREARLADSFSYPSGHSTQGWGYAMIMAALMPEKATQFLVRGRLYGESRVVCGVHWMSDVTVARTNASIVFAALQGDAAFRGDLERARAELPKALAAGSAKPDPEICAREAAAAREPPL